jgi:cardiolipin synthase
MLNVLLGLGPDTNAWWLGFLLTAQVFGFVSATQAVLETRTSQGAIAWVIVLISIPLIAVPAYWIFGRSHVNGYRKRRIREQLEQRLGSKVLRSLLSDSRLREVQLTATLYKRESTRLIDRWRGNV